MCGVWVLGLGMDTADLRCGPLSHFSCFCWMEWGEEREEGGTYALSGLFFYRERKERRVWSGGKEIENQGKQICK